ncbi:VCBS repeat-containing protein [Litoribacillus peritrichatus]|uniref:ASPIC/UnbV domain-containing protein n=1 Tax=Litoribacillus peritrichatus TaxID=718191 RepID=A0ABP7N5G4_9GAMM
MKQSFRVSQLAVTVALLSGITSVHAFSPVKLVDVSDKLDGFVHIEGAPPFTGEGLSGAAWLDYDQDGDLDLFLPNGVGASSALFRNDDGNFIDVTRIAGVGNTSGNSGVSVGDIDNNGYPDIFMTGEGHMMLAAQTPTVLYLNKGDGTFADISSTAGIQTPESALATAMADINNDGYLDIFITAPGHLDISEAVGLPPGSFGGPAKQHKNKLYLNNGDLTFTDISETAGVDSDLGACAVSFSDWDNDGFSDIFVANCNDVQLETTPFNVYRNNGDLTFTDVADQTGLDQLGFWMSVTHGDYDNDGDLDIFASNFGLKYFPGAEQEYEYHPHALFRNNGDGTYTDVAKWLGLAYLEFGWGATFADFNNDGFLDLYFAGSMPAMGVIGNLKGNPGRLYMNNRLGGFYPTFQSQTGGNLSNRFTSGVARADFDNDGFVDLLVKTSTQFDLETGEITDLGTPVLLQNAGNKNHSLTVRLKDKYGRSEAIGARIQVTTIAGTQTREILSGSSFASSESPWPTFGVGKSRFAKVMVIWQDGSVENFGWIKARGIVDLVQGQGN